MGSLKKDIIEAPKVRQAGFEELLTNGGLKS
jgi:hypothetical protein